MDNLTHSFFALTLAQTPLRRAGRGTTAALLLASNAPDIDIITAFTGGGTSYLAAHRGPSHGPLGVIGLGVVVAGLTWSIGRIRPAGFSRSARASAAFRRLLAVSVLGVALHVLMDLPTSYGTRWLSPFDDRWFAIDLLPIIDVYLLALLLAGLLAIWARPTLRSRLAFAVLAMMAGNYALRVGTHQLALARAVERPALWTWWRGATESAGGRARPCAPAEGVRSNGPAVRNGQEPGCFLEAAALPSFVSPFRWRLVRRFAHGYELTDVSLLGPRERLTTWYPHEANRWIALAGHSHTGRTFLEFARFPAATVDEQENGHVTVRWQDVRFAAGGPRLEDDRVRARGPFVAVVRLNERGEVIEERLGN